MLKIFADGIEIGVIKQGQTLIFEVPDHCHKIWGKMDWGETQRLDISNYKIDQTVVFKGRLTLNIMKNLGFAELPFDISVRQASESELDMG
ncbi:hypothetical protein [Marinicella sp. W31]|uniref:hypothetical protein n=1 Tax=Marinicella sp. W31 TaxID=3023713 RepID=UPI003756F526